MPKTNKQNSAGSRNSEYLRRLHNVGAMALELEEGEHEEIRRKFPLFVPDDGLNGLNLPGVELGDRLRIKGKRTEKGTDIRITRGPRLED